jgi:F1F0 ATPase subunit 2
MSETMLLVLALLAGMMLAAIFFGGLWWTVLKGVASPRPALWFLVSLLLRTGMVVAGFYFVSGGDWKRLLACLFGFVIARLIIIRLTAMAIPLSPSSLPQAGERDTVSLREFHVNEADHAP